MNNTSTVVPEDFDMEDQSETNDTLQLATELLASSNSTPVRRRRRSLTWTDFQKVTVRKKRALAQSLNPGPVVPNAFGGAAQVVKSASPATSQIATAVKTAVFGGDYKKRGKLNLTIGSALPQTIYSKNGNTITCQECQVTGTVDIYGDFNFVKEGGKTILNHGSFETLGRIECKVLARSQRRDKWVRSSYLS